MYRLCGRNDERVKSGGRRRFGVRVVVSAALASGGLLLSAASAFAMNTMHTDTAVAAASATYCHNGCRQYINPQPLPPRDE